MFQKSTVKLFLLLTLFISSLFAIDLEQGNPPVMPHLYEEIKERVNYNASLTTQAQIQKIISSLEKTSAYIEQGEDDLRVKFVFLQGAIEQVLAHAQKKGKIQKLVGVIHTPSPATPLCMTVDNTDETLLNLSIRGDKQKLLTISSRAEILRDYLDLGAQLYIVYPEKGLDKRLLSQQKTYLQEVKKYPLQLFDYPLKIDEIDEEMVGAFYLFEDKEGKAYAFSIKSKQASQPSAFSEWGIWLGSLEDPIVAERVRNIHHYIHTIGGPNLNEGFALCSQM